MSICYKSSLEFSTVFDIKYKVYSDLLVPLWCIGDLVLFIDSLSKIFEYLIFFDLLNFQINSFLPLVVAIVYIKL